MFVHILDSVLLEIGASIAARPPERGGALFGPHGRPLVTRFVFDEDAQTTSITYQPSRWLNARARALCSDHPLEFKGIVHSHPGSLDRPSSGDGIAIRAGLDANPQLAYLLFPIISHGQGEHLEAHELKVGSHKLSCFGGFRRRGDSVEVSRVWVAEVPLQRDLESVKIEFGGDESVEVFVNVFDGVEILGGRVVLDGDVELLFLVSELYPAIPPVLLVTAQGGTTEQLQLEWRLDVSADSRLIEALRLHFRPPGPYRRVFGHFIEQPLSNDPGRASRAGWDRYYSGDAPEDAVEEILGGLFARSRGLISREVGDKRVMICGAGSVGSYIAEQLARSGVGSMVLIDPETVEPANLSRTSYDISMLGIAKVEALTRRLLNINPLMDISAHQCGIQDLALDDLMLLMTTVDLVVAAADDPRAQLLANRFAYGLGKPAVFPGLYAGARGGEVILSVPERSPCYRCAAAMRHEIQIVDTSIHSGLDYGTGRLVGEMALGADIHHMCSVAVKLALAELLPPDSNVALSTFATKMISEGTTFLTISMSEDYWFYPRVFQDTPGQYAYQSVWLSPTRDSECPVCGEPEYRVGLTEVPTRAPQPTATYVPPQSR